MSYVPFKGKMEFVNIGVSVGNSMTYSGIWQ